MLAISALLTLAVPLLGCDADNPTAAGRSTAGSTPSDAGPTTDTGPGSPDGPAATCPPVTTATPLGELEGIADAGNSLWALLFPRGRPGLNSGEEEKIVWRMTGSGALRIRATGPDGVTIEPATDPIPHESSSWTRPGDEWGTTWNFPVAGCWTVRASRAGGATGSLALPVG
ncbi:hypothetical protein I0C86_39275 [Plantactinospora sp. S1510]|uniref:Uncharacterized protein n=1 Tax=Plantactinospora alkalitolerans TaxID=2789879 RepID=A0ABS0HA15_9ACTN|nr:hypothetical protein [Plantactinospora alkalitolerans]MBF9134922.1 hypothetical protein [Plantactinospora alkalitolerans]